MKKLLSIMLAVAMLVTLFVPMTASAAIATITLPTTPGEYVHMEAEAYKAEFSKYANTISEATTSYRQVNGAYVADETCAASGGKIIYSGSFGTDTSYLTFPLTVAEDTVYEFEVVAGFAGHLNQNYFELDGMKVYTTSTSVGTALAWTCTPNGNYPAGKYVFKYPVKAGNHTFRYVMPNRGTVGGAFVLDYIKMTATDDDIPAVIWDEEATATVSAKGKTANIVFTDAGVEQIGDTITPAKQYLIEVYPKDSKSTLALTSYTFNVYTGDKKDSSGNVLTRPTNYMVNLPLSNVMKGTFYAKIYPLGVQYPAFKGDPVISNTFTITEDPAPYAIRYELENYWNHPVNVVINSVYASNNKYLGSMQGGNEFATNGALIQDKTADYWKDAYEVSFKVNLPKDDTYDIESVMGMNKDAYTDTIAVAIDGQPVLTNALSGAREELSITKNYPWSYIYACRFGATKALTAGEHTVTYTFTRPAASSQPHLFMADYIQFTPSKPALVPNAATVFEMEDYASSFIAYNGDATQAVNPTTNTSGNASNGKFITRDTTFSFDGEQKVVPVKAEIPITVQEDGYYEFEVLDSSAGCSGYLTLDNENGSIVAIKDFKNNGEKLMSNGSGLDAADEIRANYYTYYGIKWHSARISKTSVYVPAGEYNLTVHYNGRALLPGQSGMAFCIDYVKATPIIVEAEDAVLSATSETRIEAETYKDIFIMDNSVVVPAVTKENAKASGDYVAGITEYPMEKGHGVKFNVIAEKAGWYDMGSVMSIANNGWTSLVTLYVNGEEAIVGSGENAVENVSLAEDGKTVDFVDASYLMHRFSERVYLEEGKNEISVVALPRTQKSPNEKTDDEKLIAAGGTALPYRVGYYIDYISFAPAADSMALNDKTVSGSVIFGEAVSGKLIVAAYAGKELVGSYFVDADNQTLAGIDLVCTEVPDTVKVMVWSDLTKLDPVITAKEFTFNK